ncbi:MAG TPA: MJ0042-type zinc finger domain-containing protein [Caulobacteraceae bacterium]|nr:MJ0042-type zinc finger domain-containing protein [Caulobacteraceae bacterium]
MILTCPECATRYFVEDDRLGANGRTVRCAGCHASWHARPDEPLELVTDVAGAVAREPISFKPSDEVEPLRAPELPKAFRAQIEAKKRRREAAVAGVVWAGLASSFAALLLGAYVFRVDVVKLYPKAAGAYAAAGLPVNPTGLEFEQVRASPAPDGSPSVLVTGVLRNVEHEAASAPPIRVALLDAKGARLATELVRVSTGPIAPGKTQAFSVSVPDPKALAADVDLTFALELAERPKAEASPKARPEQTLHAAQAAPKLRPSLGVETHAAKPVDAAPLPASDPHALDTGHGPAVSAAPHG